MIRRCTPLLALSVLIAAACTPADSTYVDEAAKKDAAMVDAAAFEQDLEAIQDAYIAAYNAGDAAGIAALFTEDGMMSPPMSPALDLPGIEASYVASFAAGVPMVLEVMREDFVISDGRAVAWGSFQVTATPPEGEPFTSTGRYGSVMHMDPDGTWKIFRHMFNYEVPPPGFGEGM